MSVRLLTFSIFSLKFQINALGRQTLPDWPYQSNIFVFSISFPKRKSATLSSQGKQIFLHPVELGDHHYYVGLLQKI